MRYNLFFIFFLTSTISIGQNSNTELILQLKKQLKLSSNVAKSHLEIGELYAKNQLNSNALQHYNKALKTSSSDTLSVTIINAIGNVNFNCKNYQIALKQFNKALHVSNTINYIKGKAAALSYIGNTYEKQGDYLNALNYQHKSLTHFITLNSKFDIAKVNENIGSIYEDLNQQTKAQTYFLSAYKVLKNTKTYEEANVLNNLGDVHRRLHNFDIAINYTNKALELSLQLNNPYLLESVYKDLARYYALLQDYKKAYEFKVKSVNYNEIALKNQNLNQINTLQTLYETEKKETEIQLLKEKNNVSTIRQKFLLITLIGVLLLIGIAGYFINKKRKTSQKLQEYKSKVLKAELEKKQQEENNLQHAIKLKTATASKYSLHVSQKNKLLAEVSNSLKKITERPPVNLNNILKKIIKEIDIHIKNENEWVEFNNLFNDIHPDFSKKLTSVAKNKLSPTEIKLGMLLRLNLSSKEIASILRVTPDSVRVARYRLRKKLPIASKQELSNFMLEI